MLKKYITILMAASIIIVSLVSPITSYASEIDNSESAEFVSEKPTLAEELSNYFELNKKGDISFTADKGTLMKLGISEKDAKLMTSINSNDLVATTNETESNGEIQTLGFVGLRLNLGPKIRAMNGVAAGAFAGGFVGWYVKELALTGPVGAGAAAAITASVAGVVGYAVTKNLRTVNVGSNVPYVSWLRTVEIP